MKQDKTVISAEISEGGKSNTAIISSATVLAALSASSCILPLGLSAIGLGGSWLTFLSPFVRYRGIILIAVGIVIAWSWLRLWHSPFGIQGNFPGTILTSIATFVFLGALSAPLWENDVARSLWELLRQQS